MPKSNDRRRCLECREWFYAVVSARTTQKTCSKACRVNRRRAQANERRDRDVERHRTNNRERQRACRERRRAEGRRVTEAPVSRAGLDSDPQSMKADRDEFWDRGRRVTLRSLMSKVASTKAFLDDLTAILGQEPVPVTRRPDRAGPHQKRI
jgi:hypothetical protein